MDVKKESSAVGVGVPTQEQLLGQHEVPGVAVGNLQHLALLTLALHILQ